MFKQLTVHTEFQKRFKELALSFAEVEKAIECPQNYLSRFINGSQSLPAKWETKIRAFLADKVVPQTAVEQIEAKISALQTENEHLKGEIEQLKAEKPAPTTSNGLTLDQILAEAASKSLKK